MSPWKRIKSKTNVAAIALCLFGLAVPAAAAAPEVLPIVLDQAKLVRVPDRVATIVVGNPLIADISLQPGGMMVITGKGYGTTNLLALDRSGAVLMEKAVQVEGPRDYVVVFRGMERESYTCAPTCQRVIMLGDSPAYFDANLSQASSRSALSQGGSLDKEKDK